MKSPLALAALLALAACGKPDVESSKPAACAATEDGKLRIENAWVRAQADAAGLSAAYFTLCNAGAEPVTIERLTTPAASLVEFHETTKDANGVVSMAPTGTLTLAPGEKIIFEPGGKHAMLIGLPAPIIEGSAATLTLELAGGGRVSAKVKAVSAVEAAGHAH